MSTKEALLQIVLSNDIDGVLLKGKVPRRTKRLLEMRIFRIPSKNEAELPQHSEFGFFIEMLLRWGHAVRSVREDARRGLHIFKEFIASVEDDQNISIALTTTSGREKYLHKMTKKKLAKHFPNTFNEENIRLNPQYGSGSWKELVARNEVAKGKLFIHIEDDLEAALQVARTDESSVLVFLISNASNDETLLQENEPPVILPANVIRVETYLEATKKILKFIEQKRISFQESFTNPAAQSIAQR